MDVLRLLPLLLALLAPAACTEPAATTEAPDTLNTVETIIDDMRLPHEGAPHGVPASFDWSQGPRMGMGNDPGDFRALIAWGQLYEDAAGNPATNTRVQIRNIRTYVFSREAQAWREVQATPSVDGAAYREDFAGDANRPADARAEPSGGLSVTAGDGHNYHFWPTSGRAPVDPADVGGVFTTVQARLVLDAPEGPDDRDEARYLLGMGADYWKTMDAAWDQWTTNGDVAIGRFKYVRPEWRAFNMSSMPPDALRRHPPPLE